MDAEKPKEIVREVDRGASERTPVFLGLGVTVVVGIAVAILMGIAFLVYALAT